MTVSIGAGRRGPVRHGSSFDGRPVPSDLVTSSRSVNMSTSDEARALVERSGNRCFIKDLRNVYSAISRPIIKDTSIIFLRRGRF